MKPPFCSFCGSRFSPFDTPGTTLKFAISAEDEASNQRMIKERMPHHPRGLHWICEDHIDAAKELTHLRWSDARAEMKKRLSL